MTSNYLAVRRQLEADIRTAWTLPTGAPIYVDPQQQEPTRVPFVRIRRKEPMLRAGGTPQTDEYQIVFEVIGVFRDDNNTLIDDEMIRLAGLLRKQIYATAASGPYGGYGFLVYVPQMLDPTEDPGDNTFEVSVTVAMQISSMRTDS